jgi:hypothetical protein
LGPKPTVLDCHRARYHIRVQNDNVVELSGTLTLRDLLKYQYSQCYRRTWWIVVLATLVSVAGVLLALIVLVLTSNYQLVIRNGTPFLLLLLFWTCIVTSPYRSAQRQMKTAKRLSAPIMYRFSSQGIHSEGLHFTSELSYDALWAVRETKSLFLLYPGAGSALVVPKRFFKDAPQQNHWRTVLEQGIVPKRITKGGFLGRWL